MSKEVAVTTPQVPDLIQPQAALDIDQNDVVLPRIKFGQPNATFVQDGNVPAHCLYATSGQDDPDPVILHELGDEEGVLVHVLGMFKSWSLSKDGELETWAFNDPDRHPDAWVVYNYVLALPEHDPDVPYKMLFTKTASPAAKQINTVLARRAASGPSFMTAFRITTDKREKQLGNSTVRWTVPRVRSVDATQDGVDISASLYSQIAGSIDTAGQSSTSNDEPAI
ncbi:MAG: hypothetical protein ACXVGC_12660 [Mycobacteriaceae bacterium]